MIADGAEAAQEMPPQAEDAGFCGTLYHGIAEYGLRGQQAGVGEMRWKCTLCAG